MNSTHLALLALALAGSFVYIYNTEDEKKPIDITIMLVCPPDTYSTYVYQPKTIYKIVNPLSSFSGCWCTAQLKDGIFRVQGIVSKGSVTWNNTPVERGILIEYL
jgi:hypothetical protein